MLVINFTSQISLHTLDKGLAPKGLYKKIYHSRGNLSYYCVLPFMILKIICLIFTSDNERSFSVSSKDGRLILL